ncbi:hypothetical protein C8J57DRAFT_193342 [Mycena rebaudengoi]|nr:hypothetical protein C8J57DRAFT_193342 [Mycena rebaudengoi]
MMRPSPIATTMMISRTSSLVIYHLSCLLIATAVFTITLPLLNPSFEYCVHEIYELFYHPDCAKQDKLLKRYRCLTVVLYHLPAVPCLPTAHLWSVVFTNSTWRGVLQWGHYVSYWDCQEMCHRCGIPCSLTQNFIGHGLALQNGRPNFLHALAFDKFQVVRIVGNPYKT